MKPNYEPDLYAQIVLGRGGEHQRSAVEIGALLDDDLFDLLEASEDDLLDAEGRGELDEADGEALADRFDASPGLRRRAQFARALATWSDAASSGEERLTDWQLFARNLRLEGPMLPLVLAAAHPLLWGLSQWLHSGQSL